MIQLFQINKLKIPDIRQLYTDIGYNELTENDIKKMEKEIEYRTLVVRKEALEDVKTARAHGDLS